MDNPEPDQTIVFVVHGRNSDLRRDLFAFLRALGLQPLEWAKAIQLTGKAAPFIGEILDAAFQYAQAVVVLLTPDDEVRLSPPLLLPDDEMLERIVHLQARPNVLFEAGMAFGRSPDRTILVEVGKPKPFSDVAGRHVVRLTNERSRREDLAARLLTAGCAVHQGTDDWLTTGDFSILTVPATEHQEQSFEADEEPTVKWVDLRYPEDSGLKAQLENEGYEVRWSSDNRLARRLDLEGWTLARQQTPTGRDVILKMRDMPAAQTLLKRRRLTASGTIGLRPGPMRPEMPELSEEAAQILIATAKDPSGIVMLFRGFGGDQVSTNGGAELIPNQEPRTVAMWIAALEELAERGYIKDMGYKGESFEITKKGFEAADALS